MRFFNQRIKTISGNIANLSCYVLDNLNDVDPDLRRPAMVICPGGGYVNLAEHEAEPVAIKMLSLGIQAFVLRYDTAPAVFPTALDELAASVKYLRENANKLNLDPNKIIVEGMSAGGHLAASLGVYWSSTFMSNLGYEKDDVKPNGLLLGYSVLSSGKYTHQGSIYNLFGHQPTEKELEMSNLVNLIDTHTPPSFIWQTATDEVVPVENSIMFAEKLKEKDIPFELHIYPVGKHGLSLGTEESSYKDGNGIQPEITDWPEKFKHWSNLLFSGELG